MNQIFRKFINFCWAHSDFKIRDKHTWTLITRVTDKYKRQHAHEEKEIERRQQI